MKLKDILKSLIKERDISVTQLSRATQLSNKTIHNWLVGQSPRKLEQLHKVANYFGTTLDGICGFSPIYVPRAKTTEATKIECDTSLGKFEVTLRPIEK